MNDQIKKITNHKIFPYLAITLVFIGCYWRVPSVFFIQDEWRVMALIISQGANYVIRGFNDNGVFHFIPINQFLEYSLFNLFHFNYYLYNVIGLTFHLISGFLLFILAKKIFNNTSSALLSALFFITFSNSAQLIMWPMVSLSMLSLSFGLLSLIFYFDVLEGIGRYSSVKMAVFCLLALLTVEYAFGILIFIPIFTLIIWKNFKKTVFKLSPLYVVGLIYIILRLYPFIVKSSTHLSSVKNFNILELFINFFVFPFKYFTQSLFPQDFIIGIGYLFSRNQYLSENQYFNFLAVTIGIILTIFLVYLTLFRKVVSNDRLIIFGAVFFIFCSSASFIFLMGFGINFTIIPPRYLYFGLAGSAILLSALFSVLPKIFINSKKKIFLLGVLIIIVGFIANNIYALNLNHEGAIRLSILNIIKEKNQKLPQRVIFYTQSDKSYFGLPDNEKILPFQSGFGQTILVWYDLSQNWPIEFFSSNFLWEIKDVGYKEFSGRGFGYFRDFDQLKKAVQKYNIPKDAVIAYKWDSKNDSLSDISNQIREQLQQ